MVVLLFLDSLLTRVADANFAFSRDLALQEPRVLWIRSAYLGHFSIVAEGGLRYMYGVRDGHLTLVCLPLASCRLLLFNTKMSVRPPDSATRPLPEPPFTNFDLDICDQHLVANNVIFEGSIRNSPD